MSEFIRNAGAVLAAGAAYSALATSLAGDQPATPKPLPTYETVLEDARVVAQRHDSCAITSRPEIVDRGVDTSFGTPIAYDEVQFDIEAERNAAGSAAEQRLTADQVTWSSNIVGRWVTRDENGALDFKYPVRFMDPADEKFPADVEGPNSTVGLYPEHDRPAGSRIDIFASTAARTGDYFSGKLAPESTIVEAARYCGTLTLDESGAWVHDKTAEPATEQLYAETECLQYEVPEQPGTVMASCPINLFPE